MDKTMSQRFQVLGFLMTCVIAMYHLGSPENTAGAADALWNTRIDTLVTAAATLAMSYFFASSGYLLFRGLSFDTYRSKMQRRILSLAVPYLLWQGICTVWYGIFGTRWTVKEWLSAVLLGNGLLPDGPLWYLRSLFLLALLSPIWLVLFRKRSLAWWSVIGSVLVAEWLSHTSLPGIRSWVSMGMVRSVLWQFPAYIVGAFYGYHEKELSGSAGFRYSIGLILLAFLLEPFGILSIKDITVRMLPIFALFLLPVPKFMEDRRLYRLTFLMYAIHMPLVGILKFKIRRFTALFIPYAAVTNLTDRLLLAAAVILGAGLIHLFLSRFCPKLLKLLTGGRC